MAKRLLFDSEARLALRRGVDQVTNALRVTLGPRGRNVILDKQMGSPTVTNDGVTIAREIELEDPFENAGAQLLREVSARTNEVAGDGTTTAAVLAQRIVHDGIQAVTTGANPMRVKRGVELAVNAVVASLAEQSKKVEGRVDIARVATVAANNDPEIGELLADAMERVGKDGVITVEEAKGMETKLRFVEGLQFDKGYLSAYFVTEPETMEAILKEPYILLCERKIAALETFLPILEKVAQTGRPLLVIAEEVEGDALAALVVNRLRGTLQTCAAKAPEYGERRRATLEDLAVLTGATLITEDTGCKLESVELSDLGRAQRVVVSRESTTVVVGGGQSASVLERVEQLRREIEKSESDFDKEKLQERLARLVGGVAVIEVGAPTELELKERKMRVEDALSATRSALEEGIVPGGGVGLLRALPAVLKIMEDVEQEEIRMGCSLVARALEEPARRIATNAGAEGPIVVERIRQAKDGWGFNAESGKFENLLESGIVDPAKVVRVALQNAASIGGLLLTAETLVVESPEEEDEGED